MLLVVWLVLSVLCGAYASSKGRSGFGFFILAVLLSPLIGFIVALIVKANTKAVEDQRIGTGDMKKCPHCAELVKAEAKLCRYCGRDFPESKQQEGGGIVISE